MNKQEALAAQPLLSIAIVNWNTRELLLDALRSHFEAPPDFGVEVIVVDNNSDDGSAPAVAERFPQVRLVANTLNAGYARANNQAILAARGAYILLLNPDIILKPDGLRHAVRFMQEHPDAGALGVRQVHRDGTLQRSVRGFPSPMPIFWEITGISRLFPRNRTFGSYRMTWFDYAHVAEVDQPMGAFLLLSRRAIESVGLLDEEFPIFFNDVDWCLRCRQAGFTIYFTPEVEIVHYGGASTAQAGARMAWESRSGLLKFYAKHFRAPRYWPLRALIAAASWPYAWAQARRR